MRFLPLLAILALGACPLQAELAKAGPQEQEETTELWTGSILTATFRAGVCTKKDGTARGVLYLTHANGNTDVYHVYGHKKDNLFELSHSSGHSGQIRESEDGSLKGIVRIKNKYKFNVKGRSQLHVQLTDDCAPLR